MSSTNSASLRLTSGFTLLNPTPIALRKAKIVYNFGLSECNGVKALVLSAKEYSEYTKKNC